MFRAINAHLKEVTLYTCSIWYRHSIHAVAEQWRTEGGVFKPPPPKFRSFDKAAFDCKLSGRCLVFLFQQPN